MLDGVRNTLYVFVAHKPQMKTLFYTFIAITSISFISCQSEEEKLLIQAQQEEQERDAKMSELLAEIKELKLQKEELRLEETPLKNQIWEMESQRETEIRDLVQSFRMEETKKSRDAVAKLQKEHHEKIEELREKSKEFIKKDSHFFSTQEKVLTYYAPANDYYHPKIKETKEQSLKAMKDFEETTKKEVTEKYAKEIDPLKAQIKESQGKIDDLDMEIKKLNLNLRRVSQ